MTSTLASRPSNRRARAGRRRFRRLASYDSPSFGRREVVECAGAHGSRLVVDRAAIGRGDRRLVAHIAPDEPDTNADVACARYLETPRVGLPGCRALTDADLRAAPPGCHPTAPRRRFVLEDQAALEVPGGERAYRLEEVAGRLRIPELRWRRSGARPATVSLRDVVGDLQDYEPACATTALAVRAHERAAVSTTTLAVELARVHASTIVLNRRLREVVAQTLARDDLSMSEIAMRCGRVKRDSRGRVSGETSWLARRLGLLAEGGQLTPTPWIHSDVLGLIARRGLGISPREVEL